MPADELVLHRLLTRTDGSATTPPPEVPTGFPSADRLLGGGLRRGDLVLLAGDVAVGKSAFALAVALRASAAGRTTLVASGETTPARLLERLVAMQARRSLDDLRRGSLDDEGSAAVGAAAFALREQAPILEGIVTGDPSELADLLRRALDLELAVVDGLATLTTGRRPRDEELAAAVAAVKRLAVELDVAIVLTMPLAHAVAGRADPRPSLGDLGVLGAPAQLADVVLALFREEMYQPDRGIEGAAELHLLKNRHGPTGWVDLYFYQRWLRFEDVAE
jgi:replicative DNA helicase